MRALLVVSASVARERLLAVALATSTLLTAAPLHAQVAADTSDTPPPCDGDIASRCTPPVMSLVRLLAAPERYDGKRVRVIGFVHLEFEGDAVYLHREDFERALTPNSVGVAFRADVYKRGATFNNRYALLEGTFRSRYGGAITDIWSVDVWPAHDSAARRARGFIVLKARSPNRLPAPKSP